MPSVSLDSRLAIGEQVVYRKEGGEIILVNAETGVCYGLDLIGGRVWEMIAPENSLRDIARSIAREFDAPPEVLERDIRNLVSDLLAKGLLEISRQ